MCQTGKGHHSAGGWLYRPHSDDAAQEKPWQPGKRLDVFGAINGLEGGQDRH